MILVKVQITTLLAGSLHLIADEAELSAYVGMLCGSVWVCLNDWKMEGGNITQHPQPVSLEAKAGQDLPSWASKPHPAQLLSKGRPDLSPFTTTPPSPCMLSQICCQGSPVEPA